MIDLVAKNVGAFYKEKWCEAQKKRELSTPGMRYLVAHDANGLASGFAAFLVDREPYRDGRVRRVIYVYEIQCTAKGRGVGSALMDEMIGAARKECIGWIMLTHYRDNASAERFYSKYGFREDWSSPANAEYMILSARVT